MHRLQVCHGSRSSCGEVRKLQRLEPLLLHIWPQQQSHYWRRYHSTLQPIRKHSNCWFSRECIDQLSTGCTCALDAPLPTAKQLGALEWWQHADCEVMDERSRWLAWHLRLVGETGRQVSGVVVVVQGNVQRLFVPVPAFAAALLVAGLRSATTPAAGACPPAPQLAHCRRSHQRPLDSRQACWGRCPGAHVIGRMEHAAARARGTLRPLPLGRARAAIVALPGDSGPYSGPLPHCHSLPARHCAPPGDGEGVTGVLPDPPGQMTASTHHHRTPAAHQQSLLISTPSSAGAGRGKWAGLAATAFGQPVERLLKA